MVSHGAGLGPAPSTNEAASSSTSSSFSSSGVSRGATASRGHDQHPHRHRYQHQVNAAAVEVSPGDDDSRAADQGGDGDRRDRNEADYEMVEPQASAQEASVASGDHAFGSNRGTGRADEQDRASRKEIEGVGQPPPTRPPRLRRCLSLVGLEDLPDRALARALFSGYLDSLEVASSLRHTSKRVMKVASAACKVTCSWWPPCDTIGVSRRTPAALSMNTTVRER